MHIWKMHMDCSNFADRLANQFDYLYKEKSTLSFRMKDLKCATIMSGPIHHMNKKQPNYFLYLQ